MCIYIDMLYIYIYIYIYICIYLCVYIYNVCTYVCALNTDMSTSIFKLCVNVCVLLRMYSGVVRSVPDVGLHSVCSGSYYACALVIGGQQGEVPDAVRCWGESETVAGVHAALGGRSLTQVACGAFAVCAILADSGQVRRPSPSPPLPPALRCDGMCPRGARMCQPFLAIRALGPGAVGAVLTGALCVVSVRLRVRVRVRQLEPAKGLARRCRYVYKDACALALAVSRRPGTLGGGWMLPLCGCGR